MFKSEKSLFTAGIIMSMLMTNAAFAASNYNYTPAQSTAVIEHSSNINQPMTYNNGPLRGSVITVPAGSTFSASLMSELSSENSSVGQSVCMLLGNDFYYDNKLVAPAGSSVIGTVVESQAAKHGSINGKLSVRFTQINTPTGVQIPISAVIKTDDNSGLLVGGTKMDVAKEYTKDLAAGSAAGALSGLVFGALASGDRLGRGVALGTAVGAGGGLVKSVIDKGKDVRIPANSNVELYLTQPITVTSPNYSFEN